MKRSGIGFELIGFKEITIRTKLMLSYLALIFIPLAILTTISYLTVSSELESQIKRSTSQSFDQSYALLNYEVRTLINASDVVYLNADVQSVLTKDKNTIQNDIVQQNIDRSNLDEFFNSFKNTQDVIYRVCLYVPGWLSYANQDVNFSNMDTFKKTTDYEALNSSTGMVLWLKPGVIANDIANMDPVPVISLLRKIRNTNDLSKVIGVIKVSVLESKIKSILDKGSTTQNGVVYLQNSQGTIICSSSSENLKRLGLDGDTGKKLIGTNMSWQIVNVSNSSLAVTSMTLDNTDWTMISAIPYSDILAPSNKIRNLMLILLLVIGIVAYGFATLISTSAVKRINLLMNKMKSVQQGELDVNIASKSQDEIGKLFDSFNYMVKRIRVLNEEQYAIGKEIKSAELRALQAQINPHFLYNTLDLINWKAIDNNAPEIALIAQYLAKFYKLSLNKGSEIVSLNDEIEHIRNYVQIQNLRFDNRINLIVDVGDEFYQFTILKMILQPLVENSILHGILEKRNLQEGIIKISASFDQDSIVLTVEDNGAGMTEDKASELLTLQRITDGHGYGVKNVNHRIKIYYGQQYGLTYRGTPGQGTLVEVRIPLIKAAES